MGSHSLEFEVDGNKTTKQVLEDLQAIKLQQSLEAGHQQGYSGDWQTVPTIKFPTNQIFEDYTSAIDYALDNAVKYDYGVAVKYKDGDVIKWVIGAWAVS